jgi:hypothetical protein
MTSLYIRKTAAVVCAMAVTLATAAQQAIVYPAQGQTPEQQAKDQAECNAWAQQTTGVDPVAIAQSATQPAAAAPQGGAVKGALGGAAAGAAIGAIAGDTGQGAAIGAVVGTLGGGMRQRRKTQEQQANVQSQQQQAQEALSNYTRAVSACMQGRHYVVN